MVKARKQVIKPTGPQKSDKPKSTYNIWYNKHSGERHKQGEAKQKATTRCNIAKDAGETRGTHKDGAGICLQFARGCCPLGYECSWLHVVPDAKFNSDQEVMKDCFGRERHDEVRDDQSGVGSFNSDDETCRTLYIGGISHNTSNLNSAVYKHFSEWGDIENVRVLESKGVAFVRYKYRSNAEFAFEAMQTQSLDSNEVLNIRWATKDPNPWVEKRKRMVDERRVVDAVCGETMDTRLDPKRRQHEEMVPGVVDFYPNTDGQYIAEQGTGHGVRPLLDHRASNVHHSINTVEPQDTHYNPNSQPQTLADLVAWSQKQASLDKVTTAKTGEDSGGKSKVAKGPSQDAVLHSLVGANYDSSSSDDDSS